ncbi:MAG: hypothetical protein NVSMB29_00480 [Candidatus Dormibacteria bacterium]
MASQVEEGSNRAHQLDDHVPVAGNAEAGEHARHLAVAALRGALRPDVAYPAPPRPGVTIEQMRWRAIDHHNLEQRGQPLEMRGQFRPGREPVKGVAGREPRGTLAA